MKVCFNKEFFDGWSHQDIYLYLETLILFVDNPVHYYSIKGMDFEECLVYLN